jgi:hypothetical protein
MRPFKYIVSFAASALLVINTLAVVSRAEPVQAQGAQRCFPETGFCIEGRIREFWEQNGGLPVFGYPTTTQHEEQIEGKLFQTQWFQRNRLELHPENARPYDVLLGRLGVDRLAQQGRDWFTFPKSVSQDGCRFFPETGHNVCGAILSAWHASGLEFDGKKGTSEAENLALFGMPLSDAQMETIEGRTYMVQWFERARFEQHPENAPPYDVLLGLLGNEVRITPPAPTAAPSPPPIPASVNATVTPQSGPRGTTFLLIGFGFTAGEQVGIYATMPDQSVFGAPFQVTADEDGTVGVRFTSDSDMMLGIWANTFEGVESHHKAIAYFQITP